MATIKRYEGKNGEVSYQIRVSNGFDEKGNRQMKGVTFKPKSASPRVQQKEAEKFAMELEEQVRLNGIVSVNKMTFTEVTEIWKENWLASKTPSVQEMYYDTLQRYVLPVFGNQTISKINAALIDSILHKLEKDGKAPRTVRYVFTCINSVMRYAVRKGFITENPCLRCDELPAVTKDRELHYFTLEQAKVFLNALKGSYPSSYKAHVRKLKSTDQNYSVPEYQEMHSIPFQWQVYFNLAIYGGFRRGELCALTWNDIDFRQRQIRINKSMSSTKEKGMFLKATKTAAGERQLVMPEESFRLLRHWKQEQLELSMQLGTAWQGYRGHNYDKNNVFIQLDCGKPMHLSTPTHKFIEILDMYNNSCTREEDKLPRIHLHDLRHTSATLLLSENTDIETVSHRLGHSKASVTLDIYGHALPAKDQQAADVLEAMFK